MECRISQKATAKSVSRLDVVSMDLPLDGTSQKQAVCDIKTSVALDRDHRGYSLF